MTNRTFLAGFCAYGHRFSRLGRTRSVIDGVRLPSAQTSDVASDPRATSGEVKQADTRWIYAFCFCILSSLLMFAIFSLTKEARYPLPLFAPKTRKCDQSVSRGE